MLKYYKQIIISFHRI